MKISKTTVRNYEIYDCAKWQSTIGETLMFRQSLGVKNRGLDKTGAGETYQIFGQIGLDHGPEWMSAKFTNISTDLPSKLTATTKPGE